MATTIAEIAKSAFDAVALAVTDAIVTATLSYVTKGVYNPTTGVFPETVVAAGSGRGVLDTVKPITSVFPAYVAGPSDLLVLLEGFTTAPKEGWDLDLGGVGYVIKQVQDIALAGSLFYVIVIRSSEA